ncbi:class II aldolase/adducin family protein [Candidatus Woesearchaeota archaeon]|nr:class II aldolase/adducin family protein [Candidatus Woesearchaeota archaeon]
MTYQGIKFVTRMIGSEIPIHSNLERLKYWCNVFDQKGLAPPYDGGSFGNLSFRVQPGSEQFIITAAQSALSESSDNNNFVTVNKVDLEQGIVYSIGSREPSSEAMVHAAVYNTRPNVQAVFHGHCQVITERAADLGIPVTLEEAPYGTVELVNRVLEVLEDHNFVEMKNHGFLALGKSLDEAGNISLDFLNKC